jgi:DAK2 domain fusion protein YloV
VDDARVLLDATNFGGAMSVFASVLSDHQATINRLNVFPVPDGDTGTNMAATVKEVVQELAELPKPWSMSSVCTAIAHGSLMGARGNSGVILCQILRAIAQRASPLEVVTSVDLAAGLADGSTAARSALVHPVEGTILTVASRAADAAVLCASSGGLVATLDAAREAAIEALFATPELLPVLAEAGVVDAGGAGLVLLYDALLNVLADRALPVELELPEDVARRVALKDAHGITAVLEPFKDNGYDLRYEVMFFLETNDEAIPAFKEVWAGIGDSIVVVGGEGLWNCHVHTDDVGAAIEAALDAGRPREIRVSDLATQVEEERWVREESSKATEEILRDPNRPTPVTDVVAVASGNGIRRIFRSLGVDYVITGGQSMNPSTQEILEAIDAVSASDVVILPNNPNIYPVAAQAAELTNKRAFVVETAGVQEGFAALLSYDPEASGEDNARAMSEGPKGVVAGEVTRAVRATTTDVGEVALGDYIGLSRSGIESIAQNAPDALCGLLARLLRPEHEIVTLIEGIGASEADVRKVTEWVHDHHPGVEVERHHGGQPLYPFLVSLE